MDQDPITGKTIRWTYTDGPTKGQRFEHDFGTDGHVVWRMLDLKATGQDGKTPERPKYEVARVSDKVWAVSYLAPSGWTLTTALDFAGGTMVSFASNEKQLFVQSGTFEVAAAVRK